MKKRNYRIGIFGGTFNPPHNGHISIAKQARKQLNLDVIYFIPAYIPPHKLNNSVNTAKHRLKMVELAISGNKFFKISSIELKRRGISYTIDTLKAFKKRFPKAELFLIIGADNLIQFNSWKHPNKILNLSTLAVYRRNGYLLLAENNIAEHVMLKGKLHRMSSTEIRRKIVENHSLKKILPTQVEEYIQQHMLYKRIK